MSSIKATTTPEFFESLYKDHGDPWHFAESEYEQHRYTSIVAALSGRHFRRAFEPGCSIGILTEKLAPLCSELISIDLSFTAVRQAKERCRHFRNVHLQVSGITKDVFQGSFDLIVFSEIGYYFEEGALIELGKLLIANLEPGGVLLAAHWLGQSSDHILAGDHVHQLIGSLEGVLVEEAERHEGFRLDKWVRA